MSANSGKGTIPDGSRQLKQSEIDFMKIVEKKNLERVQKLSRMRTNNNRIGLIVGGTVLSIYLYTIFSVKQEKFLDDFAEPKKVHTE